MAKPLVRAMLDVCFLGDRDYVNSASICDEIIDKCPSAFSSARIEDIRIRYHKISSKKLCAVYCADREYFFPSNETNVDFRFRVDNDIVGGWVEQTDLPIEERKGFDFPAMDALGMIQKTSIFIAHPAHFSPCQVATTSAKRLLDSIMPLSRSKRWVPAQINLERPFRHEDAFNMIISLTHKLGEGFAKLSLRTGDRPLGIFLFGASDR